MSRRPVTPPRPSRRPVTPPRPRRERSRSPLTRQQEGLVHAFQRNVATRRGGRQARARTRGIHRGLLQVLHERILRVLEQLWDRAQRRVYEDRLRQIEERQAFLERGYPENKHTVLPNIRDFYIVGGVEAPSDIESESLVETIVDSEEERDEPIAVEDGPLDFAVHRELERVSSSSTVEHIRLIERREAPDVLRPQLIFPPLPGWRQWELEVQIEDGLARIHPQTRLVVSWDFHQVLDCFRVSSRQREHCENGRLPSQVQDTLARVAALSSNPTQIVTSYCNHPSTVNNVFQHCRPQPEFAKIVVTRKPSGRVGKLQTLLQLIDTSRCFLLHVDDSPEVVTEWREYIDQNPGCNLAICGIIVPRKARDSIADYRANVYEVWNSIRGGRFG